jgi:hypothetical protein
MQAIGILILPLLAQDRAEKFFERVAIEKVEAKSNEARRVLDVLTKKENWLAAFRAVEEKIGPFPDGLTLKATFDWNGDEYAHGGGAGDRGWVRFNLAKLEEYQKKIDAIEQQRLEEEKKGKTVVLRVPPARFDRILWHELTHVLQRGYDGPDWFKEGMAVWVSDDPNCLAAFAHAGRKAEPIDAPLSERNDLYARGHLFWKWMASKGLVKKIVEATILGRKEWKASLEEATQLSWEKISAAELEWSARELEKFRASR